MPATECLQITLPSEIVAEVREAVAQGAYTSNDDVMFDALQGWRARRGDEIAGDIEGIRRALREVDENDGPKVPMEEVMERLGAKYRALATASEAR